MTNNVGDAFSFSPETHKWFLDMWAKITAEDPSATPQDLTELATSADDRTRRLVGRNPNCPPLVRAWIESGCYGGMTLKEFIKNACPPT